MHNQKMKIVLQSFDCKSLDKATQEIVNTLRRTGVDIDGPIPLPCKIERFTVNKSPHVNKKSREQFEIITRKRLVIINYPTFEVTDLLCKVDLAAGVDVSIELM